MRIFNLNPFRPKRLKHEHGRDVSRDQIAGTQRDPVLARRFSQLLAAHAIANVIDVGANQGQFACYLREELGFGGRIFSIEPLPDAFEKLQMKAALDAKWSVLNVALGEQEAVLPINIAGNSQSSSILPMLERHLSAAPHTKYRGKVDVRVARLDSLPELQAAAIDRCMLKIDTQGYEFKVLQGAEGVIGCFPLLYLELSLVPLYQGD